MALKLAVVRLRVSSQSATGVVRCRLMPPVKVLACLGGFHQRGAGGDSARPRLEEAGALQDVFLKCRLLDYVGRVGDGDFPVPNGEALIGQRNGAGRQFGDIGMAVQLHAFFDRHELLRGVQFLDLAPVRFDVAEGVAVEDYGGSVRADQLANEFLAVRENENIRIGLGGRLPKAQGRSYQHREATER